MVILCTTLKPLLEQNAPSRIVITGSHAHMDVLDGVAKLPEIAFAPPHVQRDRAMEFPAKEKAYAQTKFMQSMWAKKFATVVGPEVAVMVYNPGQCETNHGA